VWAVSLATIFVSLGGFIMTFIFAMEFMSRGDSTTGSLVFLVFFLIVVLAISALLIKQLSRLLNAYLKSGDAKTKRASLINELPTAQLAAPLEPVPPVVEQTTRRFEPSHREQKQ
jgi:hypothetical protein